MTARRKTVRKVPALAVAAALGMAACGGGGGQPSAQPAPEPTTFQPGRFDDIPLFPRSDPLGPRSDNGGVVARSYKATGASPAQILDYYKTNLDGRWVPIGRIEKIGVGTYRGDWTSGDRKLRVSATEESLGSDTPAREVTTQYSLVLEPIASP